jgi:hypothetical protein
VVDVRSMVAAGAVAVAAAIGLSTAAQRNESGQITTAGSVDAFEMRVGDCFDDSAFDSDEISEVAGIPCSEPHDNEVYATFDVSGEWPGEERIEELAFEGCYDRFEGAIGKSYEDSVIDYTTIYPSQGSWKQRDDREVICVAYHMEYDKLTGSVLGSGR